MLQNNSDRSLVFYLVLFSFVGAFMTSAVIVAISALMPNHAESSWSLRITILLQDLLVLFLPSYCVFKFSTKRPMYMLGFKQSEKLYSQLWHTLIIYLVALPAASVMAKWNDGVVFPTALSGLEAKFRAMEESARSVTDTFLAGEGIGDLFINIAIVGVAAAVVEEVFFRGGLQQLLVKWFGNGHVAVWVTAFVFSAIHLQFYGFIPRLFMGAILGYLFYYSRNLWVPIFYHLVNNATVVIMNFFWGETQFVKNFEDSALYWYSWVGLVVSLFVTYVMFQRFAKVAKHA